MMRSSPVASRSSGDQSKTLVHEVIIARDTGAKELPFDAKHERVIEKPRRPPGRDRRPRARQDRQAHRESQAGNYALFCNQPGHYKDGMVAKVIVAP